MNILYRVPDELKRKIVSYFVRPPHYFAYKTGMRIITSNELNCNISGSIKLEEGITDELQEEWEYFLEHYDHYSLGVYN
jgi:hypothetical protein|tara:strand:- start:695 stop:931 length:237 start_codon:yes stop_codon:yes gene_type:complete